MLPALPAGLVSSGCTSFAKLVVVATAVAYVMLGIDEIGVQIENPFDILPSPGPSRAMWQRSYSVQSLVMTWPVFSGVCVSKLRARNVGRYALLFIALHVLSMHSQFILYVHQASQRAESSSICNFKCEHSDSAPGAPAGSTAARPIGRAFALRSHIHRTWGCRLDLPSHLHSWRPRPHAH
jgi:hypothetical protein